MRVALDAEFFRLPPSGIGGYVRNLIPELREADPTLDLVLLEPAWDHRVPSDRRTPFGDRRVQRAAWELGGVYRAARRANADLLHIPSFAAPVMSLGPLV